MSHLSPPISGEVSYGHRDECGIQMALCAESGGGPGACAIVYTSTLYLPYPTGRRTRGATITSLALDRP